MKSSNLIISEAISQDTFSGFNSVYTSVCFLLILFILAICMFIFFTFAKINAAEKMKTLGTFKVLGATNKQILFSYMFYNISIIFYASIIGILFSMAIQLVLSIIFLHIAISITNIIINTLITLLIILSLATICFFFPARKVMSTSEKNLLLGNNKDFHVLNYPLAYIMLGLGILFSILGSILYSNLIFSICAFVLVIVALVFICPLIIEFIRTKIKNIHKCGVHLMSIKNTVGSVYLKKNISALSLIMVFLCIVCLLLSSVAGSLTKFYGEFKCDATIFSQAGFDTNMKTTINNDLNRDNSKCYYYSAWDGTLNGKTTVNIFALNDVQKFSNEFLNINIQKNNKYDLADFSKSNYIVLNKCYADQYGYKVGDSIQIDIKGTKDKFVIIAICNTFHNMGKSVYVSNVSQIFKKYFDIQQYVLIKGSNYKQITNDLIKNYSYSFFYYNSTQDKVQSNNKLTRNVGMIMLVFIILTALLTLAGIVNNYKLSYIMRLKEFATLYSVGATTKFIFRLLLFETICCGLLGGIFGLLATIGVYNILSKILLFFGTNMSINLSFMPIIITFVACIGVSILGFVCSIKNIKNNNKKLIESLK